MRQTAIESTETELYGYEQYVNRENLGYNIYSYS